MKYTYKAERVEHTSGQGGMAESCVGSGQRKTKCSKTTSRLENSKDEGTELVRSPAGSGHVEMEVMRVGHLSTVFFLFVFLLKFSNEYCPSS